MPAQLVLPAAEMIGGSGVRMWQGEEGARVTRGEWRGDGVGGGGKGMESIIILKPKVNMRATRGGEA